MRRGTAAAAAARREVAEGAAADAGPAGRVFGDAGHVLERLFAQLLVAASRRVDERTRYHSWPPAMAHCSRCRQITRVSSLQPMALPRAAGAVDFHCVVTLWPQTMRRMGFAYAAPREMGVMVQSGDALGQGGGRWHASVALE